MSDNVFLALLSLYAQQARQRLIQKTNCVQETQEKFLLQLLRSHAATALGQVFKLSEISSVDIFRQRIPIYGYEFYEPFTDRIAQGESAVLSPNPVTYINLTSGSTGNKKRVPVTRQFQRSLRRADLASIGCAIASLPQGTFGKSLLTNSVKLQGLTQAGIPYGPVSVGSIRQGKWLVNQLFSVPFKALEIEDTIARHYVCLLFALRDRQLRGWVANFPMLILRTCQFLEAFGEELISDIRRGAIASWLSIDPGLRQQLERRCYADPQRAEELSTILRHNGRLTPITAWEKLSYITTARGGTSGFYLQRFSDYFGDTPVFGGVYGTAEATFSVCPELNCDAGILAIESGFFEFIPEAEWGKEQPQTLLPCEVQVGDRYRILVTSYSGFYRYDIGDVVEVVGFYNQAPMIVFRHRYGGLLSATTEKTTEFHVVKVMEMLQHEFSIKLEDFCITLSDNEFPSRYLVNIELAEGYHLTQPLEFLRRFDDWLGQINHPYQTVRSDQVPPPILRILPSQSFAYIRQRQVQQGMFDSQLKIPHITENRQFLSGIEIINQVEFETTVFPSLKKHLNSLNSSLDPT